MIGRKNIESSLYDLSLVSCFNDHFFDSKMSSLYAAKNNICDKEMDTAILHFIYLEMIRMIGPRWNKTFPVPEVGKIHHVSLSTRASLPKYESYNLNSNFDAMSNPALLIHSMSPQVLSRMVKSVGF